MPDDEAVQTRAEELARERMADPTELYELVTGYEIDIWLPLADALDLVEKSANNDTCRLQALERLKVIQAMVMDKAALLARDAARSELAAERRERLPLGRRYTENMEGCE